MAAWHKAVSNYRLKYKESFPAQRAKMASPVHSNIFIDRSGRREGPGTRDVAWRLVGYAKVRYQSRTQTGFLIASFTQSGSINHELPKILKEFCSA